MKDIYRIWIEEAQEMTPDVIAALMATAALDYAGKPWMTFISSDGWYPGKYGAGPWACPDYLRGDQ